jgi:tetratricopeptide (TPR) repeat protein
MNEITQEAKNILYGLPIQMPQRALASTLLKVTREEGVEAAIKKYHYLVEAFPYDYPNTENELNKLASDLSTLKRTNAALKILELNTVVNPGWATYLHMARAHYALENADGAMEYYKKSLGINPGKTDPEKQGKEEAKKVLKELKKEL